MKGNGNFLVIQQLMGKTFKIIIDNRNTVRYYGQTDQLITQSKTYYNFKKAMQKVNLLGILKWVNHQYNYVNSIVINAYITQGNQKDVNKLTYPKHKVELVVRNISIIFQDETVKTPSFKTFQQICQTGNMLYFHPLFQGSMDQCLKWCQDNINEPSFIPMVSLYTKGDTSFIHEFLIRNVNEISQITPVLHYTKGDHSSLDVSREIQSDQECQNINISIGEQNEQDIDIQKLIQSYCNIQVWGQVIKQYGDYDKQDKIKLTNLFVKKINNQILQSIQYEDKKQTSKQLKKKIRPKVKDFIQENHTELF